MPSPRQNCEKDYPHVSHEWGIEWGDMGVAWYACDGSYVWEDGPIHWVSDAPTSLHGNGAASFERTTRDAAEVTCKLCLSLIARAEHASCAGSDGLESDHE